MSDVIDVQNALVTMLAAAVYPNGTGAASVSGSPIVVYPGWPTASRLDADLIAAKAHITVYPTMIEQNKTRYFKDWNQASLNTASITATIAGQTVVIGGFFPSPFVTHNLAVLVNGKAYVYAALASDTLASIATTLAALIAVDWPGTVASAGVISFRQGAIGIDFIIGTSAISQSAISQPAPNITAARIGVTGTSIREIRRQDRVFQITVWANTPGQRDVIGSALDVALAAIEFLTMPDGYGARLIYRNSHMSDDLQKAKLYRRDFQYSVEYATTQTATDTQVEVIQQGVALKNDGATQFVAARITNF